MIYKMKKKEKERTIWQQLKTWTVKTRSNTTCQPTKSKTQELNRPFYVDGQFWEAENDILKHEQTLRHKR